MITMLTEQLKSHSPERRIDALCAFVMVEETRALNTLVHMGSSESNPEVREAITWAAAEIRESKEQGYTTEGAMAQAFRFDPRRSQQETGDPHKINRQRARQNEADQGSKPRGPAWGLLTGIFGSLDDTATTRRVILKDPCLPPRPTANNIGTALLHLNDPDPGVRAATIVQLRDLNNPLALGPLARQFVSDSDAGVRQVAQHIGKLIYFSALYWQEHDAREATQRLDEPTSTRAEIVPKVKALASREKRLAHQH